MTRTFSFIVASFTFLGLIGCETSTKVKRPPVRVAVIGGMIKSGLWPEIAQRFEADTGRTVELAISGNRELLSEAFRQGKADVLTMHAGDTSTGLIKEGYGITMRPWTRNEYVIIGPQSDPAGIRGLRDGAVALQRISRKRAPFVDFQNSGTRDINTRLWQKAGIQPQGEWVLQDSSESSEQVLEFARRKQAYLVLGRIPVLPGIFVTDGMEILVKGDPEMHREFIVMEANPKKLPNMNAAGARALADYLVSPRTQNFLAEFGTHTPGGMPLFYPVRR